MVPAAATAGLRSSLSLSSTSTSRDPRESPRALCCILRALADQQSRSSNCHPILAAQDAHRPYVPRLYRQYQHSDLEVQGGGSSYTDHHAPRYCHRYRSAILLLAERQVRPALGRHPQLHLRRHPGESILKGKPAPHILIPSQLYTAFKLLSADFVDGPLRTAKKSKVFVALAALVVGIIAMSILGKWA